MAALDTPWMTSMSEPSSSAHGGNNDSHGDGRAPPTIAAFSSQTHASASQQRSTILLHQKSPLLLATPPQVTRALAYSHAFIVPLNKLVGLLSWTTGDPWESFLLVAAFWFTVLYGDDILRYAGPLILVIFLILGMYFRRYSPLSSTGWTGEKKKSHKRSGSDDAVQHRKSLDEILASLQAFTGRCNILLAPMLNMTDFLSTQQTATSATTRPALTTLFVRILIASPIWFALTLPPFRIITAKRIIFVTGTTILSWHSRPARISRAILWRSRTVRHLASLLTGLNFEADPTTSSARTSSFPPSNLSALKEMKNRNQSIRFTFSLYENQRRWIGLGWTSNMVAYERAPWTDEHLNPAPAPEKFQLPDIEGGHAKWRWADNSSWKVEQPPSSATSKDGPGGSGTGGKDRDEEAWVYYDNKWLHGTRGVDGWSKYTRRRKWVRDAELVDTTTAAAEDQHVPAGNSRDGNPPKRAEPLSAKSIDADKMAREADAAARAHRKAGSLSAPNEGLSPADTATSATGSDAASIMSSPPGSARSRSSWFGRSRGESDALSVGGVGVEGKAGMRDKLRRLSPAPKHRRARGESEVMGRQRGASGSSTTLMDGVSVNTDVGSVDGGRSVGSGGGGSSEKSERERKRDEGMDVMTPTERLKEREADWGLGDDVSMELG